MAVASGTQCGGGRCRRQRPARPAQDHARTVAKSAGTSDDTAHPESTHGDTLIYAKACVCCIIAQTAGMVG